MGPVIVVTACTLVGGGVGFAIGGALAAWLLTGRPARQLLLVAATAFALVPVAMLVDGLPSSSELSPTSAVSAGAPHVLAFVGFATLCVGVLAERPAMPGAGEPRTRSVPSRSHVLHGSRWMVAAVAVQVALNGAFALLAARLVESDPLGEAYALVSVTLLVNYATGLGLGITVARYGVGRSPAASAVFTWSVLATSAASLVGAAMYIALRPQGVSDVLEGPGGAAVLGIVVAGTSIGFLADLRLQAARRWSLVFARVSVAGAVRLPLIVLEPSVDPALWVFLVAVVPSAYTGFLALALLGAVDGFRFRLRPLEVTTRGLVRLSAVDYVATLLAQAPLYVLPVVVAANVDPAANANFFLAWSATSAAALVPSAVAQVVLVEGASTTGRQRSAEAVAFAALVCAALWAASLILGPVLVAVAGEQFEPAADLVPTLMAGCIPAAVIAVRVSEARLARQPRVVVAVTLITTVAVLTGAGRWVPADGLQGAGRSWLVGNIVGAMFAVLTTARRATTQPDGALSGS